MPAAPLSHPFLPRYTKRFASPILDIFSGQLRSSLKCTKCGHVSNTWDQFCDLSLSVPDGHDSAGDESCNSYAYSRQSRQSSG